MADAGIDALAAEVENQCHFALFSIRLAEGHLAYLDYCMGGPEVPPGTVVSPPPGVPPQTTQFWAGAQGLLAATACLSKLFWPGGEAEREQRKPLRERFQVPESWADSPIGNRDVRNSFEHIDREIVKLAGENPGANVMDLSLSNRPGQPPGVALLRYFDGGQGVIRFAAHEFHVPSVRAEVERLLTLV